MTLAALLHELESTPDCATCAWYQQLPKSERELFDRYIALSTQNAQKYSRERLFVKCVEMGYQLKSTAFKECIRRHHVHQ